MANGAKICRSVVLTECPYKNGILRLGLFGARTDQQKGTLVRVATLNVQNLRLQKDGADARLHGAWDTDAPEDTGLDRIDRRLTAELLADIDADVVALQEVFDLASLDHFHDAFLLGTGTRPYPHRICLPGNDGRGLDVALLSRVALSDVQSHATLRPSDLKLEAPEGVSADLPIFRRDCLMATVGAVTLVVCHFKSPYPEEDRSWNIRRLEALATRRLIERRFEAPERSLWIILGDLNEPDGKTLGSNRAIAPLEQGFSVNLVQRMPAAERWTYFDPHSRQYHCPDLMLASPAMAETFGSSIPFVVRKGLGREAARFRGSRLDEVGEHRPHASDHAALVIDFPEP